MCDKSVVLSGLADTSGGRYKVCPGDSGGPALIYNPHNANYELIGAVSRGLTADAQSYIAPLSNTTYSAWLNAQMATSSGDTLPLYDVNQDFNLHMPINSTSGLTQDVKVTLQNQMARGYYWEWASACIQTQSSVANLTVNNRCCAWNYQSCSTDFPKGSGSPCKITVELGNQKYTYALNETRLNALQSGINIDVYDGKDYTQFKFEPDNIFMP